ncbi:MAG: phosphoglucosamine mutase, partial [Pirellulales bacterium]
MARGSTVGEPIISVSGLRGVVGESLTPELAMRFACTFAGLAPPGPIVLTRDGRASGTMLTDAIRGGLAAVGRDVLDVGVAATPTTGVLVRQVPAAGGIQVSASHNPAQYNGLKLFSAEGRVLSAAAGRRVIERFRSGTIVWAAHDRIGSLLPQVDSIAEHARLVLSIVDAERIRKRRFRVLLDSNHGAGGLLGQHLLAELGCQVTMLGQTADGRFDHVPEPTAENLAGVLSQVASAGADAGFCQDPDADRLAIIDEQGNYLGEEYTLALCADHVLRNEPGPVVTNCSSSRMTEDLAQRYKVPFFRTAVGEANVVEAMESYDAVLGGEGNGGVIDPRVGYVRDAFVGMALVLDAMAARGLPLSSLAAELPRYEIVKTKVTLPADKVPGALAALERHFSDAQADRLDGLRLDWPGKWLLVRASNTEPIVRVIAEAGTAAEARRLC